MNKFVYNIMFFFALALVISSVWHFSKPIEPAKFAIERLEPSPQSEQFCQNGQAWKIIFPRLNYKAFDQTVADSLYEETALQFDQLDFFAKEAGFSPLSNFQYHQTYSSKSGITTVGFSFCTEVPHNELVRIMRKAYGE